MKQILIFFMLYSGCLFSQQLTQFSMYFQNRYSVNPAVAGTESYIPIMLSHKQYWTGIDGAPKFQQISAHGNIARRAGMGCKIFNYQTGPLEKSGAELTYTYQIPLNLNTAKLSFGLSGLIYQYRVDMNKVTFENPRDPLLTRISDKLTVPDFNFGIYYYSNKAYLGFSVNQMLNRKINLMVSNLNQNQVMHFILHGGYNFMLTENFSIEPNVLFKLMSFNILQADAGIRVKYQYFWLGASFRTDDAIVCSLGFSKDNIIIGYSYDYVLYGLSSYTNGSHEILLGYKINPQKPKLKDL